MKPKAINKFITLMIWLYDSRFYLRCAARYKANIVSFLEILAYSFGIDAHWWSITSMYWHTHTSLVIDFRLIYMAPTMISMMVGTGED